MFEKFTLEDYLQEEQRMLDSQNNSSSNNSATESTDNYSPLYDNSGWCSRFN